MQYEFDTTKSTDNFAKHGVSMRDADDFDWETADIWQDQRCAYPEPRFVALGLIETRLHVMVFCYRGKKIRVISLRKANAREEQKYADKN
jgi:uncharacterized DUF497 family protein